MTGPPHGGGGRGCIMSEVNYRPAAGSPVHFAGFGYSLGAPLAEGSQVGGGA
jgi:hypothetical protein